MPLEMGQENLAMKLPLRGAAFAVTSQSDDLSDALGDARGLGHHRVAVRVHEAFDRDAGAGGVDV